jgi:hypothetical protein
MCEVPRWPGVIGQFHTLDSRELNLGGADGSARVPSNVPGRLPQPIDQDFGGSIYVRI